MLRWWLIPMLAACGKRAVVEPRIGGEQIAIGVDEAGASVEQLEQNVAAPIERAMAKVAHVAHVRTTIEPGHVTLTVELADDLEAMATANVRAGLERVTRELPADVAPPIVRVVSAETIASRYTLRSSTIARAQLAAIDDALVHDALERTAGVRRIETCGAERAELRVELDPSRLATLGASLGDVAAAMRAREVALAPGSGSIDELAGTPIVVYGGVTIRLRDVAQVREGSGVLACRATDERGAVIAGAVYVRADHDPPPLRATFDRVRATLPPGVTLEVIPATTVELAIDVADPARVARVFDTLRVLPKVAHALVTEQHGVARVVVDPAGVEEAAIAALRQRGFVVHARGELVVQILGPDRAQLTRLAGAVAEAIRARPELALSGEVDAPARPELAVIPDRELVTRLGVSMADLTDAIRATTDDGLEVGSAARPRGPVVLAIPGERDRRMQLAVRGATGALVPVSQLVRVEQRAAAATVHREDGVRWVGITASGDPAAIHAAIAAVALPAGYRVRLVSL